MYIKYLLKFIENVLFLSVHAVDNQLPNLRNIHTK